MISEQEWNQQKVSDLVHERVRTKAAVGIVEVNIQTIQKLSRVAAPPQSGRSHGTKQREDGGLPGPVEAPIDDPTMSPRRLKEDFAMTSFSSVPRHLVTDNQKARSLGRGSKLLMYFKRPLVGHESLPWQNDLYCGPGLQTEEWLVDNIWGASEPDVHNRDGPGRVGWCREQEASLLFPHGQKMGSEGCYPSCRVHDPAAQKGNLPRGKMPTGKGEPLPTHPGWCGQNRLGEVLCSPFWSQRPTEWHVDSIFSWPQCPLTIIGRSWGEGNKPDSQWNVVRLKGTIIQA